MVGGFLSDISQEACHRLLQCTPKTCMRVQVRTSMGDFSGMRGLAVSPAPTFSGALTMSQVRQMRQTSTKTRHEINAGTESAHSSVEIQVRGAQR
jgi:hypothetical protein